MWPHVGCKTEANWWTEHRTAVLKRRTMLLLLKAEALWCGGLPLALLFYFVHFLQCASASGVKWKKWDLQRPPSNAALCLCLSRQLQKSAHKHTLKPFVCVRRRCRVTWVAPRLQLPWDWSRWRLPSAPPETAALLLCSCSCCFSLEICSERESASVNRARTRMHRKSHTWSSSRKPRIKKLLLERKRQFN